MVNMNSEKSVIICTQLQKARQLIQLPPEEVASELNTHPQDIIDWEEGLLQPNLKQLEKLAELYGREIAYFLRETPAPPEKIEFRGKPGQSLKELSKEARIVLARFDELCRTALEFENLLGKEHIVSLPRFKSFDSPKTVAYSLREKFNVGNKPIANLRDLLEAEGVRIFEQPVPGDEFSGFSLWHSEYGPCILINAREPKGRRNFTLGHELAHLLYDQGSSLCFIELGTSESYGSVEYKANQVSIQLLLPESGVVEDFRKRDLSNTPSEEEMAKMAYSKWCVSIQALGYRLENLGLIEKGHTATLLEPKPKHFRRPKSPAWERQLGKGFVKASFEAYQKGLISSGKLAHSLGITIRKTLEEISKRP